MSEETLATAASGSMVRGQSPCVTLGEQPLTIADVVRVGRDHAEVALPNDLSWRRRVEMSAEFIRRAVESRRTVYGVNTGFGGMSGIQIEADDTRALQKNLIWFLKAGAGKPLPSCYVRGAMLLRVKSFLPGASAVRWELLDRLVKFLNLGISPLVREFGSIGASGDLVPLASVAGALVGLGTGFQVEFRGQWCEAVQVLREVGMEPLELMPKEGLALVNGTSMSSSIAAHCWDDASLMFAVSLGVHALMIQGLNGMRESFAAFIHDVKPHPGQVWVARRMRELLKDSRLMSEVQSGTHQQMEDAEMVLRRLQRNPRAREGLTELVDELRTAPAATSRKVARLLSSLFDTVSNDNSHAVYDVEPIQDRYSIRCLPQFLGPLKEGFATTKRQIEIEMNSANDNPLVDIEDGRIYHGGNFLGQYVALAMDQLRLHLGLLAKHLDAQIALLVAPEFNAGLPPSLVGNLGRSVNMGLKGLQIAGNSIMPILSFLGNPIADRFPTHAEQFNQNISSQSFASANLTRQALDAFHHFAAIALMFGVQAVDLRTRATAADQTCDARRFLSAETGRLYQAVRDVVGSPPREHCPYITDDDQQCLDEHIARLAEDLSRGRAGRIAQAVDTTLSELELG